MKNKLTEKEKQQVWKDIVTEQEKKGNVVFLTFDGPMSAKLDEFVEQRIEGLLYDLNRLPEVVFTYMDDPKWVNDYAVYLVIKKLKELLDAK